MAVMMLRYALVIAIAFPLAACGDSTVLTGPDAEAALTEAQAVVANGGNLTIRGTRSLPGTSLPVIFVDGVRIESDSPTAVLRALRPDDIDRIEVKKGCHAWGYMPDARRNNGIILIYTDDHDGTEPDLIFDRERAEACSAEYRRTGRFPWVSR